MLQYVQLMQPKTLDEAYHIFMTHKMAMLLAGGCWTRLGSRVWPCAIDLSGVGLRYIKEKDTYFAIGAMATQWDVEQYEPFKTFAKGLVANAVRPILGVPFRNTATMGGSIASKFGFSDIIPTLVALEAEVVLHNRGVMPLMEYMKEMIRDILVEIRIPKKEIPIAVQTFRKSVGDFPFLTGAISKNEEGYHIYIGSRPSPVAKAYEASSLLNEQAAILDETLIKEVAQRAAEELTFQSNSHASAAYRQAMTKVMVTRMIREVLQWK